jgi:cystathionine beta-synthase
MDQRVDAVVCGVGSAGTITGLTRFFRSMQRPVNMILADPQGSVLAEYTRSGRIGTAGSWQVEGIGEDFVPPIADLSGVSQAYSIDDQESFAAARELFRVEGVFAGSSSGTLLAQHCGIAAAELAGAHCHVRCDTGAGICPRCTTISGWLTRACLTRDRGRLDRLHHAPVRRRRRGNDRADGHAFAAHGLFKPKCLAAPVVDQGGSSVSSTSPTLLAVVRDAERLPRPVERVMSTRLDTVSPDAPITSVQHLERGMYPSRRRRRVVGLITRSISSTTCGESSYEPNSHTGDPCRQPLIPQRSGKRRSTRRRRTRSRVRASTRA